MEYSRKLLASGWSLDVVVGMYLKPAILNTFELGVRAREVEVTEEEGGLQGIEGEFEVEVRVEIEREFGAGVDEEVDEEVAEVAGVKEGAPSAEKFLNVQEVT